MLLQIQLIWYFGFICFKNNFRFDRCPNHRGLDQFQLGTNFSIITRFHSARYNKIINSRVPIQCYSDFHVSASKLTRMITSQGVTWCHTRTMEFFLFSSSSISLLTEHWYFLFTYLRARESQNSMKDYCLNSLA